MRKRTLLGLMPVVLVAAAASTAVQASDNCPFDGFYVGLGVGETNTIGHTNNTSNGATSGQAYAKNDYESYRQALKKQAFTGAVFAGYGMAWDSFYLGAEAGFKANKSKTGNKQIISKTENKSGTVTTDTSTDYRQVKLRTGEFNLDLRPGVVLAPNSLLYVKVGAAFNRLSTQNKLTNTLTSPGVNNTSTLTNSQKKKNVVGLRLGAGLEQNFCDCWSIRADYTYTHFKKVEIASTSATNVTLASTQSSSPAGRKVQDDRYSARLSSHTVMLGLSYYW